MGTTQVSSDTLLFPWTALPLDNSPIRNINSCLWTASYGPHQCHMPGASHGHIFTVLQICLQTVSSSRAENKSYSSLCSHCACYRAGAQSMFAERNWEAMFSKPPHEKAGDAIMLCNAKNQSPARNGCSGNVC